MYEEHTFSRYAQQSAMHMFLWTLLTQWVLGWAVYPLQALPAFGSVDLSEVPAVIREGTLCALGVNATASVGDGGCGPAHALIFWAYCAVDFCCYLFGLYMIRAGGATQMVLAVAVALPLQQLVLTQRALVGRWAEQFFPGDAVALVLALAGFVVYQRCSREGKAAARPASLGPSMADALAPAGDLGARLTEPAAEDRAGRQDRGGWDVLRARLAQEDLASWAIVD